MQASKHPGLVCPLVGQRSENSACDPENPCNDKDRALPQEKELAEHYVKSRRSDITSVSFSAIYGVNTVNTVNILLCAP